MFPFFVCRQIILLHTIESTQHPVELEEAIRNTYLVRFVLARVRFLLFIISCMLTRRHPFSSHERSATGRTSAFLIIILTRYSCVFAA